jgi:hypothetical protein
MEIAMLKRLFFVCTALTALTASNVNANEAPDQKLLSSKEENAFSNEKRFAFNDDNGNPEKNYANETEQQKLVYNDEGEEETYLSYFDSEKRNESSLAQTPPNDHPWRTMPHHDENKSFNSEEKHFFDNHEEKFV